VINLEESETDRIYLDATQSIEKRVEDLIGRMTIEEKVAQLGSQWAVELLEGRRWSLEKLKKKLNHGIGQITRIGGGLDFSPEEVAIKANEIQNFLINETRLGIPAIIHEECLSGLSAKDATYFPQIIGIASTWEPELVKKMTTIIRNQMKVVGADQALSPVLDIARDPRWGRTEECFGEDPYLVARMGIAYIHGLQGDSLETGILATGKHFVGYGSSMGGRNWGPSFIPQRELLEVYAKPFEAAIKEASLGSIMNAYHEIDGLPCGFSHYFLTELLRNKLGFNGMVVSDYFTVKLNSRMHQIASSPTKAGILAINAGLDVELPTTDGFGKHFVRAAKRGEIKEEVINKAVKRVLKKKFELGLFENPLVDDNTESILKVYNDPENKKLAKQIAQKSIVLLKNRNNTLPLKKDLKSIAIIGPSADSVRNLFGDYAHISHFEAETTAVTGNRTYGKETGEYLKSFVGFDSEKLTKSFYDVKSILEELKDKVSPDTEIYYSRGCGIRSRDKSGFVEAIENAKKAEVIVFVGGGRSGLVPECTSGESRDRASLNIPGVQEDLIRELHTLGIPIVLILLNGRPLSIQWEAENLDGIIEAWLPGQEGAEAVIEVLFGDYNPGGKLPISILRTVGQVPLYHNIKPTGIVEIWSWNYVDVNTTPLYPFGYGLSYTEFEYSNLRINKQQVNIDGEIEISLELKNIGEMKGDEVVQLYLYDREADVTRPIEELFGFKRVTLEPNETVIVTFTVFIKQLGFYNKDMEFIVEPGFIDVYIGSVHSIRGPKLLKLADIFAKKEVALKGKFEIIGEKKNIENEKVFFSQVRVDNGNTK